MDGQLFASLAIFRPYIRVIMYTLSITLL